ALERAHALLARLAKLRELPLIEVLFGGLRQDEIQRFFLRLAVVIRQEVRDGGGEVFLERAEPVSREPESAVGPLHQPRGDDVRLALAQPVDIGGPIPVAGLEVAESLLTRLSAQPLRLEVPLLEGGLYELQVA